MTAGWLSLPPGALSVPVLRDAPAGRGGGAAQRLEQSSAIRISGSPPPFD